MTTTIADLRRDLAGALRLAAQAEMNEGICNHFSVVVSGKSERYLINPYGIHWAEPTFLDLVEYLQGRLGGARVLLLCLTRPDLSDRRPGWLQESRECPRAPRRCTIEPRRRAGRTAD